MKRRLLAVVLSVAGTLLLLSGVREIYEPAALVVGGAILLALGLFGFDVE